MRLKNRIIHAQSKRHANVLSGTSKRLGYLYRRTSEALIDDYITILAPAY